VTAPAVKLVVFDFDGTLAHRPGMWTQCLLDVLDEHLPGHCVTLQDIRPLLRDGFPWHTPELDHTHVDDAEAWWDLLRPLLSRAFVAVGLDAPAADALTLAVRARYCDPRQFLLYDDTLAALELVRSRGARAVILSNHVPELPSIVGALRLGDLVDAVITSALIGYEKPHPEAFRQALGHTPPERACMIGDNPVADVAGAEGIGMRTILVRHPDADYPDVLSAVSQVLDHRESAQAPD